MHFLFFFSQFCITIGMIIYERMFTMISNQILQNTIDGIKSISRVDLCVVDADGKIVAKTVGEARECMGDVV